MPGRRGRDRAVEEKEVSREFVPPEEESNSKKLEAVKNKLFDQRRRLGDAKLTLEKTTTQLVDSHLEAARFRVERALAAEKEARAHAILTQQVDPDEQYTPLGRNAPPSNHTHANTAAALRDMIDKSEASRLAVHEFMHVLDARRAAVEQREAAYDRVFALHNTCAGLAGDESKLWIDSHRRMGLELDQIQRVHTKMVMYVAWVVRERKVWQAAHAEDALGTTRGFFTRCNELLKLGRPLRFRFGDDSDRLSDKYMSTLVEAGKTVHIGARDEIDLLQSLVDTLSTGRTADGTVLSLDVVQESYKNNVENLNKQWAERFKGAFQTMAALKEEMAGVRASLKEFSAWMAGMCAQMLRGVHEQGEQLILTTKRHFHTASAMFAASGGGAGNMTPTGAQQHERHLPLRRSLVGLRSFAESLLDEVSSRKSTMVGGEVVPNPPLRRRNSSARSLRGGPRESFRFGTSGGTRRGSRAQSARESPAMQGACSTPLEPNNITRMSSFKTRRAPHAGGRTATFAVSGSPSGGGGWRDSRDGALLQQQDSGVSIASDATTPPFVRSGTGGSQGGLSMSTTVTPRATPGGVFGSAVPSVLSVPSPPAIPAGADGASRFPVNIPYVASNPSDRLSNSVVQPTDSLGFTTPGWSGAAAVVTATPPATAHAKHASPAAAVVTPLVRTRAIPSDSDMVSLSSDGAPGGGQGRVEYPATSAARAAGAISCESLPYPRRPEPPPALPVSTSTAVALRGDAPAASTATAHHGDAHTALGDLRVQHSRTVAHAEQQQARIEELTAYQDKLLATFNASLEGTEGTIDAPAVIEDVAAEELLPVLA